MLFKQVKNYRSGPSFFSREAGKEGKKGGVGKNRRIVSDVPTLAVIYIFIWSGFLSFFLLEIFKEKFSISSRLFEEICNSDLYLIARLMNKDVEFSSTVDDQVSPPSVPIDEKSKSR